MDSSRHTINSNNGGGGNGGGGPRSPSYYNNMNRTENHSSNNPSGPPHDRHGHGYGPGPGHGHGPSQGHGQNYGHYDGQDSYGHNSPSQGQGQQNYRGNGPQQSQQYGHGPGPGYGHGQNQSQGQGQGQGQGQYYPSQNHGSNNPNNQDVNYDPRFYSESRSPAGENEQNIEGLLPPLKQLDINQIPPDILAYLLKSTRIDQLVANSSSAHNQQQQQQQQQQQRPGSGSGGPYTNRSSPPASMQNMPSRDGLGSNQPQPLMRSPNTPNSGPYNNPNNEWNPGPGPGPNQGRNNAGGGGGYGNRGPPQQQQQQQQQHRADSNWSRGDSVPSRNNSYNQQQSPRQFGKPSGPGQGSWNFSPGAKEFVPRSPHGQPQYPPQYNPKYQNQPHHQQSYQQQKNAAYMRTLGQTYNEGAGDPLSWSAELDSVRGPKLENYMLHQFDLQGGSASDFDTDVDCVLETVTDTINKLAMNPPDFDRASRKTVDVLKKYLNDVDTLGVIVTLIFEQSVSNANFCFSGAKLCQVFNKNEISVGNVTFKNLLLQRCQEEFTSCLQSMGMDEEMEKRTPGLILFFAELYLNFFVEISGKSVKNMLFGSAALELMTKLVSIKPVSESNFKCVFRTLKLIGWDLDHEPHHEVKRDMDKLLDELSALRNGSDSDVEPAVKGHVETLFQLREKDWNMGKDSWDTPVSDATAAEYAASSCGGIQYYELPDTVDEDDDDLSNLLIDDEPEEVGRAYEEFLKMTAANLN